MADAPKDDVARRTPDTIELRWMVTARVPTVVRLGEQFHLGAASMIEEKLGEAWRMVEWAVEPGLTDG